MNDGYLLKLENISKSFPGVKALKGVNFDLKPNEVHCLVGENGAGKSTLIKIIAGVYKPDAGAIYMKGQRVLMKDPRHTLSLGISVVFQETTLIDQLTVSDNITLGRENKRLGFLMKKENVKFSLMQMEKLGIKINPTTYVGGLSLAEKRMVEIIKAIATDVSVLILDEPTASLTKKEIEKLFDIIKVLKDLGKGIIYVSHRLEEVFEISNRITVLRDGEYIFTKDTDQINKTDLIKGMIGKELTNIFPSRESNISEMVLLSVRNVCKGILKDISFDLHSGEVLGIAGLVGAGKTIILNAVFGIEPIESGEIFVKGRKVSITKPCQGMEKGIGLIPEERRKQGIVGLLSVRENISMCVPDEISKFGFINYAIDRAIADKFIEQLRIMTPSRNQILSLLSGGNQQKVVISKWLASQKDILLLDEPTHGIDVGAKFEIYSLINKLVKAGMGILLSSSELPELIGICDNIIALYEGKIVKRLGREEFSKEKILSYITGVEQ